MLILKSSFVSRSKQVFCTWKPGDKIDINHQTQYQSSAEYAPYNSHKRSW